MKATSKAARRQWWRGLTPKQQQTYISKKQEDKANARKLCPVEKDNFPRITPENREQWLKLIVRKNPWLRNMNIALFTNLTIE